METGKMSYEPMEIDRVPYMGLPDCKDCPGKRSTVIEHRLYGNSGFGPEVIGRKRIERCVSRWRRQAAKERNEQ